MGFSGGLEPVAGSAVFNAMVILALSIIAVVFAEFPKSIEVSTKVIYRDSFALIILQLALIGILYFQMLTDRWFDISFFFTLFIYFICFIQRRTQI